MYWFPKWRTCFCLFALCGMINDHWSIKNCHHNNTSMIISRTPTKLVTLFLLPNYCTNFCLFSLYIVYGRPSFKPETHSLWPWTLKLVWNIINFQNKQHKLIILFKLFVRHFKVSPACKQPVCFWRWQKITQKIWKIYFWVKMTFRYIGNIRRYDRHCVFVISSDGTLHLIEWKWIVLNLLCGSGLKLSV